MSPLRCLAYTRSRMWIAECIDLDLSAEGPTLELALGGLQDAMIGYLTVALQSDPTGLIPRKSPLLPNRLRYRLRRMAATILGRARFHLWETRLDQALPGEQPTAAAPTTWR